MSLNKVFPVLFGTALALGLAADDVQAREQVPNPVRPKLAQAGLAPSYIGGIMGDRSLRKKFLDLLRSFNEAPESGEGSADEVFFRGEAGEGPLQRMRSETPGGEFSREPYDLTVFLPQVGAYILNQVPGIGVPSGTRAFSTPRMFPHLSGENEGAWAGPAFLYKKQGQSCWNYPDLVPPAEGPQPKEAEGVLCETNVYNQLSLGSDVTQESQWLRRSSDFGDTSPLDYRVEVGYEHKGLFTGQKMSFACTADIDVKGATTLTCWVNFPETECREKATWPGLASHAQNFTFDERIRADGISFNQEAFARDPREFLDYTSDAAYKLVVSSAHVEGCEPEVYSQSFPTDPEASFLKLAQL
jgi:hypothetical protein